MDRSISGQESHCADGGKSPGGTAVYTIWGTKRILTDLGAEFQGQLFQEMCKRFEIDQVRTTPYEPRTNGQVERFHRTLNSMLGKSVQQNQRDWDDRLPYVMAAYRASHRE